MQRGNRGPLNYKLKIEFDKNKVGGKEKKNKRFQAYLRVVLKVLLHNLKLEVKSKKTERKIDLIGI